jgi:PEP-CTERM motif-containing protein
MKRVVLLAVLMLALPIVAFANSTLIFTNAGGSVQLKSGALVGTSQLTSFTNSGGTITGALGGVSYSTGSLVSRNLTATTDTWTFNGGGFFKITSNGSGLPSGAVFTGTFTSPVTFVGTFNPAGDNGLGAWSYTLTGSIAGTLGSNVGGGQASGGTVQLTFDVHGHVPFSTSVRGKSGITTMSTVPEPGTLGLLGTGLLGIAGLVRRRFRSPV